MKKSRGFTLLELIIVLGLAVVVMTGVFAHLRTNNRRNIQNASLAIQADLRYAQRRAMTEGIRYFVHFEPSQNRYHIMRYPNRLVRTAYVQNGVNLFNNNFTNNRLIFLPRGTASMGGTIILNNPPYWQHITATVSGGRIRVFEPTRTNQQGVGEID